MKSILYITSTALFILFSSFSCGKQEATVAVVRVIDQNNQSIEGAQVIIYGSGTQGTVVVNDTLFTDAMGEAHFELSHLYQPGQAGVAVLDILATKGGVSAQGIIKVEQETTSRETVRL